MGITLPQTLSLLPHPNSWEPSDAGSRLILGLWSGSQSPYTLRPQALPRGSRHGVCEEMGDQVLQLSAAWQPGLKRGCPRLQQWP